MSAEGNQSNNRKEDLEKSIRKRVELEKSAHSLVETLSLSSSVTEAVLLDVGQHIMLEQYVDITEERAISNLCGYPICCNMLKNIPKQKYFISRADAVVYDITERKKFCSNFCLTASKHFQLQISSTPLWLREKEQQRQLSLLPRSGVRGSFGEIVARAAPHVDIVKELEELEELDSMSLSSCTVKDLKKTDSKNVNNHTITDLKNVDSMNSPSAVEDTKIVNSVCSTSPAAIKEPKKVNSVIPSVENNKKEMTGGNPKDSRDIKSLFQKRAKGSLRGCFEDVQDPRTAEKTGNEMTHGIKQSSSSVVFDRLKSFLYEWKTNDTVAFVRNESNPPEAESSSEVTDTNTTSIKSYMEEVEESRQAAKKLPEMQELIEQTKTYELKVKEFYNVQPQSTAGSSFTEASSKDEKDQDVRLPCVDNHSQMTIRRRVVLERLENELPDVLQNLGLRTQGVMGCIRKLVKTFRFSSKNLLFKPNEWTLVTLILLKMLAQKEKTFFDAFAEENAKRYFNLCFNAVNMSEKDVGEIIYNLTHLSEELID